MGPTTRSSMRGSCIKSPKKYVTRSALENSPKKTVVFLEESQVPKFTELNFSKIRSVQVRQAADVKQKSGRKIKKPSICSSSDEGLGDVSFGACSTLLPDIPPALARPTHSLKQVLCLELVRFSTFCH